MYVLHAVEYPDRRISRPQVENAWTGAGLPQPVPALKEVDAGPREVRAVFEDALGKAGAMKSGGDGDVEIPRSSALMLEKLEEFYHRLYPETRGSTARGHFQYEELEWLGEF